MVDNGNGPYHELVKRVQELEVRVKELEKTINRYQRPIHGEIFPRGLKKER